MLAWLAEAFDAFRLGRAAPSLLAQPPERTHLAGAPARAACLRVAASKKHTATTGPE